MLHHFLDDKPWFAAKRYGFGAGLPIAWQGWALLASYLACVGGIFVLMGGARPTPLGQLFLVSATLLFGLLCWYKTEGGWRWRWGDDS